MQYAQMRLSSRVHTLRAQTLISRAAGVPSSSTSSVASHQHLRCEIQPQSAHALFKAQVLLSIQAPPSTRADPRERTAGFLQNKSSF